VKPTDAAPAEGDHSAEAHAEEHAPVDAAGEHTEEAAPAEEAAHH
jgi:hypothetical protein